MYYLGEGVPTDYAEAVAWFRKAAERGGADGMYSLGVAYEQGNGVPRDNVQAHVWYSLAASRYSAEDKEKHDKALAHRDDIASKLTRDQIAEAKRLAHDYLTAPIPNSSVFTFSSPEGKSYAVTAPDGTTKEQAWCLLQGGTGDSCGLPAKHKPPFDPSKPFQAELQPHATDWWKQDPVVQPHGSTDPPIAPNPPKGFVLDQPTNPQDWGAVPANRYDWTHDPALWGYVFAIAASVALLGLYFTPLIIARRRRHRQTLAIGMLNLSLGAVALVGGVYEISTVIVLAVFVWLGLLTWACIKRTPRYQTLGQLEPTYEKERTSRS